jgi:hypothetical protein
MVWIAGSSYDSRIEIYKWRRKSLRAYPKLQHCGPEPRVGASDLRPFNGSARWRRKKKLS